jgi:hypothetical protein
LVTSLDLSYRAPNLADLDQTKNTNVLTTLADRSAGSGFSRVLIASGGNADLTTQHARTWSIGINLDGTSLGLAGARLRTTFYDIHYDGRIENGTFSYDILNRAQYNGRIIRNPSAALLGKICAGGQFQGSAGSCLDAQIDAILDLRLLNEASLDTQGIDFDLLLPLAALSKNLTWGIRGTYILNFEQIATPSAPPQSLLNELGEPINLRFQSSLQWHTSHLTAALDFNFQNDYHNLQTTPATDISSWSTFDVRLQCRLPQEFGGLWANTEIGLSVQNLFSRNAPYAVNLQSAYAWDQANATIYGRLISFYISKQW